MRRLLVGIGLELALTSLAMPGEPAPRFARGCDEHVAELCRGIDNIPQCHDKLERLQLLETTRARRQGELLTIRLKGGTDKSLSDSSAPGPEVKYRYFAYLPDFDAHLVMLDYYECGEAMLVGAMDGREFKLPGCPLLSPDGKWAALTAGCFDYGVAYAVEIWNVTKGRPERVFRVEAGDWLPAALSWEGSRTLHVKTQGLSPRPDESFTVSLSGTTWTVPSTWH